MLGGKFGDGGYKVSGGLHGVGISVVNALSANVEVEIDRDGIRHFMSFKDGGKPDVKLKPTGDSPLDQETGKPRTGTTDSVLARCGSFQGGKPSTGPRPWSTGSRSWPS